MALPEVVSREEWLEARRRLLAEEKEMTRRRDAGSGRKYYPDWEQGTAAVVAQLRAETWTDS